MYKRQVEHPVTEVVTGIDIIKEQIHIAAEKKCRIKQKDVVTRGHAIEFRINAEDPAHAFRPSPGRIVSWRPPSGADIRLDSHTYPGYEVPSFYDSLLGKLIVCGNDRDDALVKSRLALDRFIVEGVATTIPFHLALLDDPEFQAGDIHTGWVDARGMGGLV